jgi:hypothetical protein
MSAKSETLTIYVCAACRQPVFSQDHVIPHAPAKKGEECSSHFVEQLPWMQDQLFPPAVLDAQAAYDAETEELDADELRLRTKKGNLRPELPHTGKLYCPSCKSERIGTFCWSGRMCSCRRHIHPAFQFPKSGLDFVTVVRRQEDA